MKSISGAPGSSHHTCSSTLDGERTDLSFCIKSCGIDAVGVRDDGAPEGVRGGGADGPVVARWTAAAVHDCATGAGRSDQRMPATVVSW